MLMFGNYCSTSSNNTREDWPPNCSDDNHVEHTEDAHSTEEWKTHQELLVDLFTLFQPDIKPC